MMRILALMMILVWSALAHVQAQSAAELDARADTISKTLSCLHCDGRSIYDVDNALANDMRVVVRRLVDEGRSNLEIRKYFTDRYGSSVELDRDASASVLSPEDIASRTEAVSKTLRCVVCQNQSIYDSNAPLAEDMRRLVQKRIEAGDTNDEAREYLRDKYGDYVLMSPPLQLNTILLWAGPLILIIFGVFWFRGRLQDRQVPEQPALSDEDRARVAAALADEETAG